MDKIQATAVYDQYAAVLRDLTVPQRLVLVDRLLRSVHDAPFLPPSTALVLASAGIATAQIASELGVDLMPDRDDPAVVKAMLALAKLMIEGSS